MITRMNYLLLSTMMLAAIDNTFGKCCPCEKEEENGKINNVEDLNQGTTENVTTTKKTERNSKDKPNDEEIILDPNNNTTFYFKISQNTDVNTIKRCINNNWYNAHSDRVVALEQVSSAGEEDALSVTGQKDNWNITSAGKDFFEYSNCDSSKNTWVIVEIKLKVYSDPVFLYVDTISSPFFSHKKEIINIFNVFTLVECYRLNILAANTSQATNFSYLFFSADVSGKKRESVEDGFLGLDHINASKATNLDGMFFNAISEQYTFDALKRWRPFKSDKISVKNLFSPQSGLNHSKFGYDLSIVWEHAKKKQIVWNMGDDSLDSEL